MKAMAVVSRMFFSTKSLPFFLKKLTIDLWPLQSNEQGPIVPLNGVKFRIITELIIESIHETCILFLNCDWVPKYGKPFRTISIATVVKQGQFTWLHCCISD